MYTYTYEVLSFNYEIKSLRYIYVMLKGRGHIFFIISRFSALSIFYLLYRRFFALLQGKQKVYFPSNQFLRHCVFSSGTQRAP